MMFILAHHGDKMGGEGADDLSLMCAMDSAFSHLTWVQVITLTRRL